MKQTLLLSVILLALLFVPVASAFSVKETVESFYTDEIPDVVVADHQDTDDNYAAIAFENEFGLKNITLASKFSSDKTLVIIGGPCANPLWKTYTKETCDNWQYPEHKALLISIEKNGKTILLIGGTTGRDTRAAARFAVMNFSNSLLGSDRVVLDTTNLPLANEKLKVYKTTNNLGEGESSAVGNVIIEIPDDASGGDQDLADGLEKHIKKAFPYATVEIQEESDVSLGSIGDSVLVILKKIPIISVGDNAPAGHVVIATSIAFWATAQGFEYSWGTHNQLTTDDIEF